MFCPASPLIAGKQSPILLISSNIPSRSSEPQMDGPPLPRPPQLPFPNTKHTQASRKLSSIISPFIQLQQAPHQYWIESEQHREPVDVLSLSWGPFCNGTLMDPSLLSEIPGLADKLKATSNKSRRLLVDALGRYPTLADDATETVVQGTVYDVEHKKHLRC